MKKSVEKEYERLFLVHFKELCFYTMNYINEIELAKDLVHDVFTEVWKQRNTIDFSKPIYPLLLTMVRNKCINHLAHHKVIEKFQKHEQLFQSPLDSVEVETDDEVLNSVISRIDTLPKRSRQVLRLFFLEQKKYKEISEILNISINTVKTHMSFGMKVLRSEFTDKVHLLFIFCKKN